ncbi:hypothetical protein CL614_08915 [archaeon]|nr:hypothetical protein [archaeon]|tara:strand:- start:752 stop:1159 length:408 start_codon:yes stop_codon:yes gene_type:complete
MKLRNIWKKVNPPLQLHSDERGDIVDVFYKENIHHVAVVRSKKGVRRGDHYHKKTIQYMLITKGSLEYWHRPLDSKEPAQCLLMREGDFIVTPPNEVHALNIIEDNEFVVFTTGERGGQDYESDTIRLNKTIIGG